MCHHHWVRSRIRDDIGLASVPDELLTRSCYWGEVSRAYRMNRHAMSASAWQGLCSKRGRLLYGLGP